MNIEKNLFMATKEQKEIIELFYQDYRKEENFNFNILNDFELKKDLYKKQLFSFLSNPLVFVYLILIWRASIFFNQNRILYYSNFIGQGIYYFYYFSSFSLFFVFTKIFKFDFIPSMIIKIDETKYNQKLNFIERLKITRFLNSQIIPNVYDEYSDIKMRFDINMFLFFLSSFLLLIYPMIYQFYEMGAFK